MSTTRTIGQMGEDGDKRGVLYHKTFFVLSADKATYTPTYKQTGSDAPFLFPADTYIYDWKITAVSDHWLIVVNACDDDFDWGDKDSQLSGCIDQHGNQKGTIYTAKFNVEPLDRVTYIPTYGINGNQAPWNFPAGTYIYDWDVQSNTEQLEEDTEAETCGAFSWNVTVKACNDDYDWDREKKRIGDIKSTTTKDGTKYIQSLLVTDAEKIATYTPAYGQDGDASPFGFVANTYIYAWEFTPVYTNPIESTEVAGFSDITSSAPSHWSLTVMACSDEYNWANAHRVGEIKTMGSERGTKYRGQYFIPTALKATYTPAYEDDASLTPFLFPAGTYIYQWDLTPVYSNPSPSTTVGGMTDVTTDSPSHWVVIIDACNNDYDWGTGDGSDDGEPPEDKVKKSYGMGEIFFPIEWFGIIHWERHPLYYTWQARERYDSMSTEDQALATRPIPPSINRPKLALDATSTALNAKDLVFANAPTNEQGSCVISEDAKTLWTSATDLATHVAWAGQNVRTVSFTLEMYRAGTTSPESYIDWAGVNGGFSSPAGCIPNGYTSNGTWKSEEQFIESDAKFINGNWYALITRKMLKAPDDLKFATGGAWGDPWSW